MNIPRDLINPRLFSPGPTPVPMKMHMAALPVLYHRSVHFTKIFRECQSAIKPYIGSKEPPIFLACSGTGAMEAVVQHLCAPGMEVGCLVGGKFGERWQELAQAYGTKVHAHEVPWGQSIDFAALEAFIKQHKQISAFFMQAVETSTAVSFPTAKIATLIKRHSNALVVVDAISALVSEEFAMDDWGIDVVVGASQKCFSTPPGLCFVALSNAALQKQSKLPRFYFDLIREYECQKDGSTAFTPPVSLFQTLHASLDSFNAVGKNALISYYAGLAKATRAALTALSLPVIDHKIASNTLSLGFLPQGFDGKALIKNIEQKFNATIAGGQDRLQGKIVRIAHIGMVDPIDTLAALIFLKEELLKMGLKIKDDPVLTFTSNIFSN